MLIKLNTALFRTYPAELHTVLVLGELQTNQGVVGVGCEADLVESGRARCGTKAERPQPRR